MSFNVFSIIALSLLLIHCINSIRSGLKKERKSYWVSFTGNMNWKNERLYITNVIVGSLVAVLCVIGLVFYIKAFF